MAKKERTPEQIEADRERMARVRAARQQAEESKALDIPTVTLIDSEPEEEVITLDLTKENLVNEASVTELVRRMFDDGNYPDVIKVTSSQMIETFDPSHRTTLKLDGVIYRSPFGEHWVDIIPRKELDQDAIS